MYYNKVEICGINTSKLKVLTDEEKRYLESLFPDSPTFLFGHPSRQDPAIPEETECYRSQYGIHYRNARTGLWSDLRFSIIEV